MLKSPAFVAGPLVALLTLWLPVAGQQAGTEGTAPATRAEPDLPDTTVTLPDPTGPHPVGTVTRVVRLHAPEPLTPDTTDRRELVVQLFYPARRTEDAEPAPYMSRLGEMRRGLREHGFPPFAELADRLGAYAHVRTAVRLEAPVLVSEGPFPVLLFSPGGNVSRHWYTGLVQELASHRYVVALMSHAHSGLDVFPEAGFLASHPRWHPGPDVPAGERADRDDELSDRLAEDALATLDHLAHLSADDAVPGMEDALDLTRVGIVGHSRGGSTVTRVCAGDGRPGACIVLDNIGSHPETERGLDRPHLAVRTAEWSEGRVARLRSFLEANRSEAFEVVVPGTRHMSFSDLPLVDPATHPPGELDPPDAHRAIAAIVLGFLDEHLRGEDGALRSAVSELGDRALLTGY